MTYLPKMPRILIILSPVLLLSWSCASEEREVPTKEIPAIMTSVESGYSAGGFTSAFWAKKISLDIVADGDLNFNVDWSYLKTYLDNNQPKLYVQDPLEGITYDLSLEGNQFAIIDPYHTARLEETITFIGDSILYGPSAPLTYVRIDSGRVVYDYFFAGSYQSQNTEVPVYLELGRENEMTGWEGATRYESHYNFEKPVFTVLNGETVIDTFYIQDCNGGFQLFEIVNKEELGDVNSPVEVGTLQYTFIKI